jgi:hypothetical protein
VILKPFDLKGITMPKMTTHDLQCPHCGNKQKTMIWDTLNITRESDLKNKLYAGEINRFECKKCEKKSVIEAPLLYHDMSQQFCVQYFPPKALDDPGFLQQFNRDGSFAMTAISMELGKSAYLTRPHIVFDMNEMLRYVAFRDRIPAIKMR